MSARRVLAAAISFAWLLPAILTGGVALHVAFEHPVPHPHQALPASIELRAVKTHGQLGSTDQLPHKHSTVVDTVSVAIRRCVDAAAQQSSVGSADVPSPWLDLGTDSPIARVLAGPPKASGPPLLARLSILRI